MDERRAEQRFMCSDLVSVELEDQGTTAVAILEDVSPLGACLEIQEAVPVNAMIVLNCSGCRFRGRVRYCTFRQTGYQVGLELMECKWSKKKYEPKHLLDSPVVHAGDLALLMQDDAKSRRLFADLAAQPAPDARLYQSSCLKTGLCGGEDRSANRRSCCDEESCPRADISRLIEPESPLSDRIRVVARAVAWTCEELSPADLKQCFSRWFQIPPECALFDEFLRAYQAEHAVLSSKPAGEKRMAAGGHFDGI